MIYLAKTYKKNGAVLKGRDVASHCKIVGEVARELVSRLDKRLTEQFFPPGYELTAALHDIGKISPYFQEKIYRNFEDFQKSSLSAEPEQEKNWGGHAGVSRATLSALLRDKSYQALGSPSRTLIPLIAGQHHGSNADLKGKTATAEVFGDKEWNNKRLELVEELKSYFGADFPVIKNETAAKVISGLTSVADWIGSGSLFDDPAESWGGKIEQAVREVFILRCQPSSHPIKFMNGLPSLLIK